jgi:hypothetical protein
MNSTIQITPTLGSSPSRHFPQWKLSVIDAAQNLCSDFFPDGLNTTGAAYTDAEWNILHPPLAAGGPAIPRPIPVNVCMGILGFP